MGLDQCSNVPEASRRKESARVAVGTWMCAWAEEWSDSDLVWESKHCCRAGGRTLAELEGSGICPQ